MNIKKASLAALLGLSTLTSCATMNKGMEKYVLGWPETGVRWSARNSNRYVVMPVADGVRVVADATKVSRLSPTYKEPKFDPNRYKFVASEPKKVTETTGN